MKKSILRKITAFLCALFLLVSMVACNMQPQVETSAPTEESSIPPTETQETEETEATQETTEATEETTEETTEATTEAAVVTEPQISAPVHTHNYVGANCTQGGKCECGAVSTPLGHNFNTATCVTSATCTRCGASSGAPTGHNYSGGKCTKCGDTNGPLAPWEAALFHNKLTDEQNAQALAVAKQIAYSIPAGISDLERVTMAAQKVSSYYIRENHVESGPYYNQAYGVFVAGESSCAGCTRALGLVLSLMGYSWTHVNENQYSHQWCRLTMDGQVGYADGQVGWANYGPHPVEGED